MLAKGRLNTSNASNASNANTDTKGKGVDIWPPVPYNYLVSSGFWTPAPLKPTVTKPSTPPCHMKAVVAQSDLNQALKVLARNYDRRAKHPVLLNVLLTADADAGKLVATVYDLGNNSGSIKQVSVDIAASVETSGSITASVSNLKDIVNGMPKTSAVILSFDPDDSEG